MKLSSLLITTLLGVIFQAADALKCYRCYSTQEGCGKELSIRLNRLNTCPSLEYGAGENFCVKVIEKRGSEEYYTRECLSTLMEHTYHRQKIPTVQRHGYCTEARNNDPNTPTDKNTLYCFCNDWNGCNGALAVSITLSSGLVFSVLSYLLKNWIA